ncbi:hypothetical protein PTKIN_Ptkin08bG0031100 [Pterospermum kingtungense]
MHTKSKDEIIRKGGLTQLSAYKCTKIQKKKSSKQKGIPNTYKQIIQVLRTGFMGPEVKALESIARRKQAKKRRVLFSKRLTHTDTSKRLAIPTKSLAFLPHFCGGHALELPVRDDNGHCWTFVCSIRKTGAYQKPVFQQCWREFVVAKRVNVGDKVTFYEEEAAAEDGIKIFGSIFSCSRYCIEIEKIVSPPTHRAALVKC